MVGSLSTYCISGREGFLFGDESFFSNILKFKLRESLRSIYIFLELIEEAKDKDAWCALFVFAPVIAGLINAVPGAAQLFKNNNKLKKQNFLIIIIVCNYMILAKNYLSNFGNITRLN